MITGIREKTVVKEDGTIEIAAPDLPVGAQVEVIVLVEENEQDTTEYLLSTEANRRHLMESMRDAANPEKLIYVDIDKL
jgi:antitoxin YefM